MDDKNNAIENKYVKEVELQNNEDDNNSVKRKSIIKEEIFNKIKNKLYLRLNIVSGIIKVNKNIYKRMKTYCIIEIGKIKYKTEIDKKNGK